MDGLIRVFTELKALDTDMTLAQALCLLLIAKNEGLSLSELANKSGVGMASASRYVSAMGKPGPRNQRALGFITATEDPLERRKKVIQMTTKGRTFVNKLIGA